jgi:hypothetical protein
MALLFSVCILFPLAGILSDRYGRKRVMVSPIDESLPLVWGSFTYRFARHRPFVSRRNTLLDRRWCELVYYVAYVGQAN